MPEARTSILVVDDDTDLLEVLQELFRDEGYEVRTASSGSAALESVREHGAPDLVLLDVMMPDMDGEDVARALAAQSSTTRILVMSALPTQRDRDRFRGCRVEAFLGKPLRLDRLLEAVAHALAGPGA